MKLIDCSCGFEITTKNKERLKKSSWNEASTVLCFDCPKCGSTVVRTFKKKEKSYVQTLANIIAKVAL